MQLKYFTTLHPAAASIATSKREPDAWMCLYVNVSGAYVCACVPFQKMFFIFSHFLPVLILPPSSQRQAKVYYEFWISQPFLFKSKFSSK